MMTWILFLISIGSVFILMSTMEGYGTGLLFLGLILIAVSLIIIFKRKKD